MYALNDHTAFLIQQLNLFSHNAATRFLTLSFLYKNVLSENRVIREDGFQKADFIPAKGSD